MPPAWAIACFLVSGAAGLLYEVVWSKVLSQVMGNSLHAISTVVACFLAGLALGAWIAARVPPAPGRAAIRYARLELGIAVLGALSVPLLRALDPALGTLAGSLGGGPAFLAARFALLALVLLPPTILMGATLPVLVGGLEPGRAGATLARLYAINTVGAVAGTALGGFVLMPALGLSATTWLAAVLNAVAALSAWRQGASVAAAGATAAPAAPVRADERAEESAPVAFVATAIGLSGFAALLFQMAWVRLFANLLGSSTYSFSGVLAVYLAGLAVGAALIARPLARGGSLALFGVLQAALALAAAFSAWVFPRLPDAYLGMVQSGTLSWARLQTSQLALVAAVVLVPCALLGAVFPLAIRLLGGQGARATGTGYALNTIGTITGAIVGGYLLVPRLGVLGTHDLALAISAVLAVGAALLSLRGAHRGMALSGLVVAALAAVTAWAAPRWDPQVMSAGLYRPVRREYLRQAALGRPGSLVEAAAWRERLLYVREGEHSTVVVARDSLTGELSLRLNGKVDASTGDMLTQVLLGLVPAALSERGARTLVIGHGSGVTLSAALAAGAGRTDLVELEPAVLEASRFFHAAGTDPLDDARTTVHVEDGRTALARARGRFDLIVSEPSNPWLAGVNNLFTADFYRLARSRLAPGGVFCQWLQLYEVSPGTLGSILAAFLETFPRGHAFMGTDGSDLLLCAMDQPHALDLARLDDDAARREIQRAKLPSLDALAGYYVGPFSELRPLAQGQVHNTDDRPIVEFRAPRDMVELGRVVGGGSQAMAARLPVARWSDAREVFAGWSAERWYRARTRELARTGRTEWTRKAVDESREQLGAAFADSLRGAVGRIERRRSSTEAILLAQQYAAASMLREAADQLRRATELDSTNARAWSELAEAYRLSGQAGPADVAVRRALALSPPGEQFDALLTAGFLAIAAGRRIEAAERFGSAQREHPRDPVPSVYEARARFEAGDTTGARQAYARAAAIDPSHPEVRQAARYLGR